MGRFTDPHPFTCSFFTPYLHCLMFRQCRLPQPSPNPFSEWRIIFFHRGHLKLQYAAFAGPPGPAFSFSAFLLPARPLACVDGAGFLSSRFAAVLDSFTTGSHGSNGAGLGLSWGRFPSRPPKPHTSHAGASLVFLPKTSLPLPLRGRGRVPSILGLLGLPCSSTTGSRVSNRAGLGLYWCRFPTLSPDRP